MGDLRLSGFIIQKSRFISMKEWRTIRQKSGCLNHLNERIFQVNIQIAGMDQRFLEMGLLSIKLGGGGRLFADFISLILYPMKMK